MGWACGTRGRERRARTPPKPSFLAAGTRAVWAGAARFARIALVQAVAVLGPWRKPIAHGLRRVARGMHRILRWIRLRHVLIVAGTAGILLAIVVIYSVATLPLNGGLQVDPIPSALVLAASLSTVVLAQRGANHFFGVLRIDAFTSIDSFYEQMDSMKATLRAAPRLPGAGPLTFAGEPEAAFEEDCRKNGIPYHPSIIEGLRKMCTDLEIDFDLVPPEG